MRRGRAILRSAVRLALILAVAACRPDEPRLAEAPPDTLPPLGRIMGEPPEAPGVTDPTTRLREADLLDRHVLELRTHLATMRQISPRMAGTVMNEHAAHVQAIGERLTSLRARLTVPDAALPTLIGMRADEYRVIQDEARTAAAEVDHFRQADEDTIRERMPGHLDRLEQLAGQMEQMAAGLRR